MTVAKTIGQTVAIRRAIAITKVVETMARTLGRKRITINWASTALRRSRKTLGKKPTRTLAPTMAGRGTGPLTADS
jgi:hypothetical protein